MSELDKLKPYFTEVENTLKSFPKECSKNYFDNKSSLKIKFLDPINRNLKGNYEPKENTITIYDISSSHHELFHMSFSDRDKLNKEIYPGSNMYYDNGISIRIENRIIGKGLTEGFAEYLSRKHNQSNGKEFNYYFANLLISIYGEEIINYALKNDPVGFFGHESFHDIYTYIIYLDYLDEALINIQFVAASINIIKESTNKEMEDLNQSWSELIKSTKEALHSSLINLFKSIINEFDNCTEPKITKSELISNLNIFLTDPKYKMLLKIDREGTIEKELRKIIAEFNKSKKLK